MLSSFSGSFKFGRRAVASLLPNPVLKLDALDYSGSGSTWQSSIGPDATLVNTPTYVATSPTYFNFNGVDEYAEFLHEPVLKPTSAITLEQWITADDWTAGDSVNFLASLSCTQAGGYSHYIWEGTWRSYVRVGGSYQIPTADVSSFVAGSWHHVVTTFDGQYTKLYFDGVLVDTEDLGTSGNVISYDSDNSIIVGAEATGTTGAAGQYWAGKVGLTRIWNQPLNDAQVAAIYQENVDRFNIFTDNLVVHLDAGDPSSYPGSGTTWTNLVDSSNYTIWNGSFDSNNGGSIVFDGSNTFVPIDTPLSNGTNFTKEAWVYADVVSGSRNILSSANNVFWNNGSTLSGGVGGSFSAVTSSSFPSGVWRHVALTFDDSANTMTLYVNGTQVSQNTNVTQSYVSETERIGAHFFSGNPVSFWDGKIAQVRVYNTALSNTNILQNFNVTKSRFGL